MSAETTVICNLLANQGAAGAIAERLRPLAEAQGTMDWHNTAYHRHAIELAQQAAAAGRSKVIAIGGDGTVHEVVNGLMSVPADRRPALGIIPTGSGNDFSHSLGIPRDAQAAWTLALTGSLRPVDVGHIRDDQGHSEYWTNTLGIGFDALVNIRSRGIRIVRGFGIYFLSALQTILFNHVPMQAKVVEDDRSWQKDLLMLVVCNGQREGGVFQVAPQARQDDGWLDYLAIGSISKAMMVYTIPFMMNGTHSRLKYASHGRFARMEFASNHPLHIHSDGEIYAGMDSRIHAVTITAVGNAIRVALPAAEPSARDDA